MSSAKAALESDTRVLAFEAGRKLGPSRQRHLGGPVRVARRQRHRLHRRDDRLLRASTRRCPSRITAREVGTAAAFLCSPLASGITGHTLYVDKGYHAMGVRRPTAMKNDSSRRSAAWPRRRGSLSYHGRASISSSASDPARHRSGRPRLPAGRRSRAAACARTTRGCARPGLRTTPRRALVSSRPRAPPSRRPS